MHSLVIIGCGAIVPELHAPVLRRLERDGLVRVVGLVDLDRRRASGLRRWFSGARPMDSAGEALDVLRPSLALVASPAGLHADHVRTALAHGCHVVCEKPLAASRADAIELGREAASAGRILMTVLPRRFFPNLGEVARRISAGEAGDRLRFTFREGGDFRWPITTDAAFRREIARGGVLRDKGAHVLDTLVQLFGPGEVTACADDSLVGGVEGNVVLEARFRSAAGVVQLSWDHALRDGLWITGDAREYRLDTIDITRLETRRPGDPWRTVDCAATWPGEVDPDSRRRHRPIQYQECAELLWIHFLRVLGGLESSALPPGDAAMVAGMVDDAYAMARPLDLEWLPERERLENLRRHWRKPA